MHIKTMINTIKGTNFQLPGQTKFYKGKVRDVYTVNNETLVMVASDRISAFDHVLPVGIPSGRTWSKADILSDATITSVSLFTV